MTEYDISDFKNQILTERRTCVDCGGPFFTPVQSPFNHCPYCYFEDYERQLEGDE